MNQPMSKMSEIVEMISSQKKKLSQYPSITMLLRIIYSKKIPSETEVRP